MLHLVIAMYSELYSMSNSIYHKILTAELKFHRSETQQKLDQTFPINLATI